MIDKLYAFIGEFCIESGNIAIIDPYFNKLCSLEEKIPINNDTSIHTSLNPGIYRAYHQKDSINNNITSLIILKNDFKISDISDEQMKYLGNISTFLSSAVAISDTKYIYKTQFLYNFFGMDVCFDADRFISDIPKMPYPKDIKNKLYDYLENMKKQGKNPVGKQLVEILQTLPIWIGFKAYDDDSTAWTVDVLNKLYCSDMDATLIKSGVASRTESGEHSCYLIHRYDNQIGILIHLDAI